MVEGDVLQRIPPLTGAPGIVNVIVEIPKGRRSRFERDKKLGIMRLDR
jgi:inorganic pyrophosphatase